VDFAFDDDQLAFRAQLRALADKTCTPADIRAAWASAEGYSPARWEALAEMGVVGITVPEAHGGLGLGFVDLVLLLEEAGRAGLPEPLLETTALAVPLLVEAGGERAETLRQRWLPEVATGRAVVSVGVEESGVVPAAMVADLLLLVRDGEVHAVASAHTERRLRLGLDGGRRPGQVAWSARPETRLARGAEAEALVDRLRTRAATGAAAMLLGAAERLITTTAAYAGERVQFGAPIGSFQAVKHHLAGALVRLEFSRPAVYRAAWSIDAGDPEATYHASMAKALASQAALGAARVALQVHGAIGYTWEHDIHLWMKPAWALAAAWGDAPTHRARVLAHLVAASEAGDRGGGGRE